MTRTYGTRWSGAFISVPLPEDRVALEAVMQQFFEDKAGIPLECEGGHIAPRFDTDGMSSGYVSPEFGRTIGIPLLLDRAELALRVEGIPNLLQKAKELACDYRALAGEPLGITGEVAEFAAAQTLGLELASAREAGYDAVRCADGREIRANLGLVSSGPRQG